MVIDKIALALAIIGALNWGGIGTPITEVIIPTGNCVGAIIFLPTVSDSSNKRAPTNEDTGII